MLVTRLNLKLLLLSLVAAFALLGCSGKAEKRFAKRGSLKSKLEKEPPQSPQNVDPPEKGGGDDEIPAASDDPISRAQALDLVHKYLSSQLMSVTIQSGGKMTTLQGVGTYKVASSEQHEGMKLFYKLADTYDNALAAIFWTEAGKPSEAKVILDSFIRIMALQGYDPKAATATERTAKFKMLAARYSFQTEGKFGPPSSPSGSYVEDTGNNSYMGLALCKFVNKYKGELDDSGALYRQAAFDLITFLDAERKCPSGKGYRGREGTTAENSWLSVEHNLDMYAFAKCLLKNASDSEKTLLNAVADTSSKFVSSMYDSTLSLYRSGVAQCDAPMGTETAVPVDTQTWRYLADAELESTAASRSEASVAAVLGTKFFTQDADHENGCMENPPAGLADVNDCSKIDEDELFYGVKFSDRGIGVQLENTGAAYMALARFVEAGDSNQKIDKDRLEQVRSSLIKLLAKEKENGIPASFRQRAIIGTDGTKKFNTGFDWDYFHFPHTASTVWTGMALAYKFTPSEEADPGFNPYSPESSKVAYTAAAKMTSLKAADIAAVTCPTVSTAVYESKKTKMNCTFDENVDNGSGGKRLDPQAAFCGAFHTPNNAEWFAENLDSDAHLTKLGVTRSTIRTLCGHTDLSSCKADDVVNLFRYVWYSYAKGCQ